MEGDRRAAMRVLPIGSDHVRGGIAGSQSLSQGRRYRCRAFGEYLSVRYLRPYPEGNSPGCRAHARGEAGVSGRGDSSRDFDSGRRIFLQRSAWVAGGLVLAVALPPISGGARAARAAGDSQLNAWLRIGVDDSITMVVDRSEMGQGVYTALPMLLAEELEVDLSRIKIVAAPVGEAYVNALNGGQITGTSNSVPDAWDKLRRAGAQARLMLIAAAAQMWHVKPSECHATDGKVVSSQGRTASYGQLAAAAAKLPVPKDVPLKEAAQFRLVGKPLARLDTADKIDGSAEFGLDVQLPGMLYAVI